MLADSLRRRLGRPARWLRTAALLTAALAVLSLAVVVLHPRRAAAEDNFVTVDPMGQIVTGNTTASIQVTIQTADTPSTITLTDNGAMNGSFDETGASHHYLISWPALQCSGNNTLKVDVDYHGVHPSISQTVTGIAVLCPKFFLSPHKVAGSGPVTLDLTSWNAEGSFDSLGPYTGDGNAKKLFLDGTQIGVFPYHVAPAPTIDISCDTSSVTHTIKLTQVTPYGTLEASDTLEDWCSTWQVSPKGLLAPTGTSTFTISDHTTTYRPNTTVTATLTDISDTVVKSYDPITFAAGGQLSHTFADDGVLACGNRSAYTINLHIVQPDPPVIIHFAPRLAPIVTDEHIPFHVLCPQVSTQPPHYTIDQSALPFDLPVITYGFDDVTNVYDARDVAPKTYYLDGHKLGTSTSQDDTSFRSKLNPSCGKHTYTVTQPTGLGPAHGDMQLVILCPQVTLSPAVIASDAQPHPITVQGNGFHPPWGGEAGVRPQPYVLTVDGKQVGQGETTVDGTVPASFTATGLGCGPHDVTIKELPPAPGGGKLLDLPSAPAPTVAPTDPDAPLIASAPLVVNCPPIVTGRPPGRNPDTTLNIAPQVIIAGMTSYVTGTGFTPGHKVALSWLLPDGDKKQPACPGKVTAAKDGTFVFLCLVSSHEPLGQRTMTATDGKHTAIANALVIAGPMQPSGRLPRIVVRN